MVAFVGVDRLEEGEAEQIPEKEASTPQVADKEKAVEPVEGEGIFGMFDEEGASDQPLPQTVMQIQKREKITAWGSHGDAPANKKALATKKGSKALPQVRTTSCPIADFYSSMGFPHVLERSGNCTCDGHALSL